MILQDYIEVVTPKIVAVDYKSSLDCYVIEFVDCTIVCSSYLHKGKKVVLIKSVTDEEAELQTKNDKYQYLDHIHEIGTTCLDMFGTPFFEWGEMYKLTRYMKDEWELQGFNLQVVNGSKVIRHAIGADFYSQDIEGNYLKVEREEIQSRIDQYKRLGIPLSIPEWVLVNLPQAGERYRYISLQKVLGSKEFMLDKDLKEQILSALN